MFKGIAAGLLCATCAFSADQATIERGRAEEKRSCVACHGTRITHSQRLSRAGWEKELDKMARWGGTAKDRAALLEYLAAELGDDKPLSPPVLSADGTR